MSDLDLAGGRVHPKGVMWGAELSNQPDQEARPDRLRDVEEMRTTFALATSDDRSGESRRLRHVIGWLTEEFGDRVDAETIHQVALDQISHLHGAKVQEFVATISWRLARARLHDLVGERRIELV